MIELREAITSLRKTAWKPVVEDRDGSHLDSKFGGTPALLYQEEWPICSNCSKPLQFFCQLNTDTLPEEMAAKFGSGMIQLFYCISTEPEHCEVDCEAFFHYATSVVARLIPDVSSTKSPSDIPENQDFPVKTIVGWDPMDDFPNWEEFEENSIELSDEESEQMDLEGYPRPDDKLSGWPSWVQSIEYPECQTCGTTMSLVLQIDSEDNVPYMWGDSGCAHLTQCPEHKDQLAFGWACC